MRFVRVFLATPLGDAELNRDREALDNYLKSLTDDPRIHYQTYRWEYESGAVTLEGTKQEEYNRLVEKSDLLMVLCSSRLGPGTEAEYEAAKESLGFRGRPQILTCFRGDAKDVREASGAAFHTKVKTDGHYPQYYADHRELRWLVSQELDKLGLRKICPPEQEPMAEDGRTVEILRRIPAIENDATFHDLLKNYKDFWKKEQAAWAGAGDDLNDTDYLTARILTENARKLLKNRIGLVLAYAPREDVPNLSDYEREANELINKGDLPGANAAFSMERIQAEAQAAAEDVQRKYLRKVDLLRGLKGNHAAEIRTVLETAVRYERANGLETKAMRKYLDFLWRQHDYRTALPLAQQHWREMEKTGTLWEIGYAANMVGLLNRASGNYAVAEQAYRRYRDISTQRMIQNPEQGPSSLAVACNNLGVLLKNAGRTKEAEAEYRRSKEIREQLAKAQPEAYLPDLADTCNNLGILLKNTGRTEEAEAEYRRSKEIREKLVEVQPEAYLPVLAQICNNLGILLRNTGRTEEAEAEYRRSKEIREKLAEVQPEAYLPVLAQICNNLGILLRNTGRTEEAEAEYRRSKEIREKLAEVQPEAYLPYLATSCNNLGVLLKNTDRRSEAEQEYLRAREIRETLAGQNPGGYSGEAGSTCWNLGLFYKDGQQLEQAKEAFRAALGHYTTAATYNPRYQKNADNAQRWLDRL